MSSRVIHFEIHAGNPKRAMDFYKKVFGWSFKKMEGMEYWMTHTGSDKEPGINGGILPRPTPLEDTKSINGYVCTIGVDDFDAYAEKAIDAGAEVALPKDAIPGMAWLGYFKDTEGNCFGLFQADKNAK